MRILQALISIGTCTFIGLFTARIAGRTAGWIAFWLAALYAPFYLYSWPFLRDGLGWFLTAALLWVLSELARQEWSARRASGLAGWHAAWPGLSGERNLFVADSLGVDSACLLCVEAAAVGHCRAGRPRNGLGRFSSADS